MALVGLGYRATVADVCKASGMSRRTFYETFDSLHDAMIRMQKAMGRATEREYARLAAEKNHEERWYRAYVHAQSCFPSADTMLAAMSCDITIDANRLMRLDVPLTTASYIATQQGMRPTPEPGPFDDRMLQWATDVLGESP